MKVKRNKKSVSAVNTTSTNQKKPTVGARILKNIQNGEHIEVSQDQFFDSNFDSCYDDNINHGRFDNEIDTDINPLFTNINSNNNYNNINKQYQKRNSIDNDNNIKNNNKLNKKKLNNKHQRVHMNNKDIFDIFDEGSASGMSIEKDSWLQMQLRNLDSMKKSLEDMDCMATDVSGVSASANERALALALANDEMKEYGVNVAQNERKDGTRSPLFVLERSGISRDNRNHTYQVDEDDDDGGDDGGYDDDDGGDGLSSPIGARYEGKMQWDHEVDEDDDQEDEEEGARKDEGRRDKGRRDEDQCTREDESGRDYEDEEEQDEDDTPIEPAKAKNVLSSGE